MSTKPSNPLMSMFAADSVLIAPEKQDQFIACLEALSARPHINEMVAETASAADQFWPEPDSWKAAYRPYVVVDGILQIPVRGVLLHNFPWADGPYATGYDYIWRAFERGMNDAGVKAVALVCNTPGGMVAGCFDAVDRMFALKAVSGKPVRGFAHESAYSAGYAVISVADEIAVSRTGGVGSIGVVQAHIDWSKFNERMGVAYTFIFAGKHKIDGNPDQPLPADVKDRLQARIDELYDVFVSSVARNRPQLSEDEIRATEALTFTATQALSNKLADSIGSLDDALAAFAADLSSTDGDEDMSTQDEAATNQAAIDAAVAAEKTAAATATAEAVTAAKVAERARVAGITGCDEAKGREALASHLAMETEMSVEAAQKILAAAPKAPDPVVADPAAETPFSAAMSSGNPDVGASGGGGNGSDADKDDGSDIVALAASLGVKGFTQDKKAA